MATQRDYVFAPDVGRFVADRVLDADLAPVETFLLASGRPAAIFEIVRLTEATVGVPLLLQIDPRPSNVRDNTFLPGALAPGFRPTALAEGVALTFGTMTQDRFTGAFL
jgi:UDP-glucose 4-epimerase